MQKYRRVGKISEGAFGAVYQYENKKPSQSIPKTVAIKEMYTSGNIKRQLEILKDLPEHQNILRIYEVLQESYNVAVVMQKGVQDLSSFIQKSQYPINQQKVKVAAREILKGLNVLHDRSYIHRDIKPSNVILKDNGRLALCDFGSAVKCSQGQEYELEGFTRWYKAPEMLLGSRTYQYQVDIWSLGCILMEMATGEPYFDGKSQIQLLSMIAKELGNPNEKNWPSLKKLPDYGKISFRQMEPRSITQTAQQRSISPQLCRFIKRMVKYDGRPTAAQLLEDEYLSSVTQVKLVRKSTELSMNIKEAQNSLKKLVKRDISLIWM